MQRRYVVQEGVALNEETLSRMSKEERDFWEDFLEEASQVIKEKSKKGDIEPFAPTESLKTKYQEAITKYDGRKYCQIKQLQEIFAF